MLDALSHPQAAFSFPPVGHFAPPRPQDYRPSADLLAAVRTALTLGQPLLLTGEPGTGKTRLAHYLAHQLGWGDPIEMEVQTTSVRKDLFYRYDALGHFQWAQVHRERAEPLKDADFEDRFIRYEGLGKAIREAHQGVRTTPAVVLLDEMDKAPRDLPNDLLAVLEKLQFEVPETPGITKLRYACPPELRPFVLITSNSEKNLPDAFLRRVVYFHIKFPERAELLEILKIHLPGWQKLNLEALTDYFLSRREAGNLNKKPATAELVAWAGLLAHLQFPTERLSDPDSLEDADRDRLRAANSVLAKTREDLHTLNATLG